MALRREDRFGYGFTLVGVFLSYLLDKLFGPTVGLIVAIFGCAVGVVFIVWGHLGKEVKTRAPITLKGRLLAAGIAVLAIGTIAFLGFRVYRHGMTEASHQPAQTATPQLPVPPLANPSPRGGVPQENPPPVHRPKKSSGSQIEPKSTPEAVPPAQSSAPDVVLRFVYPEDPALLIVNLSDSVARDMKWEVILWNKDLPDRNDPLPIPVATFDWLKPHTAGGPQDLFDGPLVKPLLKNGDQLFGCASIDCPTCIRARTYFVFITYGEGGWFAEVPDPKNEGLLVPKSFSKPDRDAYFSFIENISQNERMRIKPQ